MWVQVADTVRKRSRHPNYNGDEVTGVNAMIRVTANALAPGRTAPERRLYHGDIGIIRKGKRETGTSGVVAVATTMTMLLANSCNHTYVTVWIVARQPIQCDYNMRGMRQVDYSFCLAACWSKNKT